MRIALLMHFYPPSSCGGTGYQTARLAEALQEAGSEIGVLCVSEWGEGRKYYNGSVQEDVNGIPVLRLRINWMRAPEPFAYLNDSPIIGELTEAYLAKFQPDIVHIVSMYTLSARVAHVAHAMRLPMLIHLHDFHAICPRLTLTHKDGTLCTGPENGAKCQLCSMALTKFDRSAAFLLNERTRSWIYGQFSRLPWLTRQPGLRGQLGDFERRRQFFLDAVSLANVLITPSNFAKTILTQHGVPAEKLRVIPNGLREKWVETVSWVPSETLRVVYLGIISPIKGVHVLLSAFEQLNSMERITLDVWGDESQAPRYAKLQKELSSPNVSWHGEYTFGDLPMILSNADILVAPAMSYETYGLIVQEAFAAGVPVIVSANTSLAEAVVDGVNGLHFERGSAKDLADKLELLLSHPELLEHLRSGIVPVRTLENDTEDYLSLYSQLLLQVNRSKR